MTDQVHDAGLDDRLRKGGGDRLGKALQAVDEAIRMSWQPRFWLFSILIPSHQIHHVDEVLTSQIPSEIL